MNTDVCVSPSLDAKILVFFSSHDSDANCGSSFSSILYRDTSIVSVAMPSVSKNLGGTVRHRPARRERHVLAAQACARTCERDASGTHRKPRRAYLH